MAFKKPHSSGRIVSTLVIVLLLAVAAGLYLQIILIDRPARSGAQSVPEVSVQVLEGDERPLATTPSEPLPGDQMELIMQVFAPEPAAN